MYREIYLPTDGEFLVKKVMSWGELGGSLVYSYSNFAINLKLNFLLTPSQIQIFWLKIQPLAPKKACFIFNLIEKCKKPLYSEPFGI